MEGDGFEGSRQRKQHVGQVSVITPCPEDPRVHRCSSHRGKWGWVRVGSEGTASRIDLGPATLTPLCRRASALCSVLSVGTLMGFY